MLWLFYENIQNLIFVKAYECLTHVWCCGFFFPFFFSREWKMTPRKERCWERSLMIRTEIQRRRSSWRWVNESWEERKSLVCWSSTPIFILLLFVFSSSSWFSSVETQWGGSYVCGAARPQQLGSHRVHVPLPLPRARNDGVHVKSAGAGATTHFSNVRNDFSKVQLMLMLLRTRCLIALLCSSRS